MITRRRENMVLCNGFQAAVLRTCLVKPPLTRLVDHDATAESVDGKSDNIRPPGSVASDDTRNGDA
jgi:hypothetical protein